ncbi:MAG: serine/threonine-protein kinase, partial [Kofleriaceae bacterium]
MNDAAVREALARIAARPTHEWGARVAHEFPTDPAMRTQALLWLHADRARPMLEGATPSLGAAADERYELSLRLDTGATASVWQAFDRKLGRQVAIKVFHEPSDSEALDQVLAEARAASDVISDHVVRVLDVHHGEGRPYIVMELVGEYDPDKGDIVLGTGAAASNARSIDEVARWVMHAARGVHEAHLRNVFHRDLKPNNVLITPISRRARVADFGLAVSGASSDLANPAIALLRRGPSGPVSVRGTPEYMAPEQARGLPLSLDPRVAADRAILVAIDVWGLGAIAYQLLAGRPPWLATPGDDYSAWEVAAAG